MRLWGYIWKQYGITWIVTKWEHNMKVISKHGIICIYIYIWLYMGLIDGFSSTPCLICPGYHSAQAWRSSPILPADFGDFRVQGLSGGHGFSTVSSVLGDFAFIELYLLPTGKHTKNYGKSPWLIGKSTINCHFPVRKLLNYRRVVGKSSNKWAPKTNSDLSAILAHPLGCNSPWTSDFSGSVDFPALIGHVEAIYPVDFLWNNPLRIGLT